jgi:hypothetical protein
MGLLTNRTSGLHISLSVFLALLALAVEARADPGTLPGPPAESLFAGCTPDWQSLGCPYAGSHRLREELALTDEVPASAATYPGANYPRAELMAWRADVPQGAPATAPAPETPADTSGPSDTTGYYLLGAIPLIVGVGGLVGIDHRLPNDDTGIWKRSHQLDLEYGVALTEVGGALWLGGEDRLGRTYWQSLDASVFSALTVQGLKYVTGRARPSQSASPNDWLQGSCCQSFPSGEVTLQASFVTPFILEYREDHPWVWGLEALPLYDALARMKTQGHWQTDVLSGWALGTAFGIFAHNRDMPFFLGVMPHGVMVGWHTSF